MRDYEEKSYYEIQLDNKQLILVFLAGLVLCVLIFVLGIMVGKGQKEAEMAAVAKPEPATRTEPDFKTPPQAKQNLEAPPTEEKPRRQKVIPQKKEETTPVQTVAKQKEKPKTGEDYSFYDLDKSNSTPGLEKPKTNLPVNSKTPEKPAESTSESTGIQYTVQVMATASKPKAQQEITYLKTKGYNPFLGESKTESGIVYKVRVGKFNESKAAKELAARLKQELKLEPWVAVLD